MADKKNTPYFNDEKKKKALEWLKAKAPNMRCDVCGHDQFMLLDHVNAIPQFNGTISLSLVYTHVMVGCTNCANVKFFNARVMGLTDQEPSSKANEEQKGEINAK